MSGYRPGGDDGPDSVLRVANEAHDQTNSEGQNQPGAENEKPRTERRPGSSGVEIVHVYGCRDFEDLPHSIRALWNATGENGGVGDAGTGVNDGGGHAQVFSGWPGTGIRCRLRRMANEPY
jgi:hypothetical protein